MIESKLSASEINVAECHGTGTALGDRTIPHDDGGWDGLLEATTSSDAGRHRQTSADMYFRHTNQSSKIRQCGCDDFPVSASRETVPLAGSDRGQRSANGDAGDTSQLVETLGLTHLFCWCENKYLASLKFPESFRVTSGSLLKRPSVTAGICWDAYLMAGTTIPHHEHKRQNEPGSP